MLADIADVVSRSHDLTETLDNIVAVVAKRLGVEVCSVYLVEPDLEHLTLAATRGLSREAVGQVRLAQGEGLVGQIASVCAPAAFREARAHPQYRYFAITGEEAFRSLMGAPLMLASMSASAQSAFAIGVLVVQSRKARDFSESNLQLLSTCARLIAPLVMNSQLLAIVSGSDERRARVLKKLGRAGALVKSAPQKARARTQKNLRINGAPTSRGIASGPVHFLDESAAHASLPYTPQPSLKKEIAALHRAHAAVLEELQQQRDDAARRFGHDLSAIFNIQIQLLEDKELGAKLEKNVRAQKNALLATRRVFEEYEQIFSALGDAYFRERSADVQDVGQRLVSHLLGVRSGGAKLSPGAVLVTANLLPAYFVKLETEKIAALVSEHGGATSHGAIFARALEIPAVTGAVGILEKAREGELVIVDGDAGAVVLSPDAKVRAGYQREQARALQATRHLDALSSGHPATTRDGRRLRITANAGLLSDLPLIERHGAEGIGLFRTELLALVHRGFPGEAEQQELYGSVAKAMAPQPVTIRTLDLGGDKAIQTLSVDAEENPQLGLRSIRFTLDENQLAGFRAQLRAILHASAARNVRLLVPMVSAVEEILRVRELLDEAKADLQKRGAPFDANIPVGVMIEVPAAALIADALARECDFFSIGTNDLTQYTLAVDRGNENVAYLYQPLHPAVLALIDRSVAAAARAKIPVSVCGEMASHPLAVPILAGLGIEELSGVAHAVPAVKEIVRALDCAEVKDDARRALAASTAGEVHAIAAARLRAAGLLDHPDIGGWLKSRVDAWLGARS